MPPPPPSGAASRPRILVTRAEEVAGERWEDYADRIAEAGGEPVAIDQADWERDPSTPPCDGLLVTAGIDVDPARYGEERHPRVAETAPARDDFEAALIAGALERDLPLLAVCRGHQLLNVASGGSLLQHIEEREPHRARRGEDGAIDSGWHEVAVAPGSLLASALGEGPLRVNSRHHQAVTADRVAPGLAVAATALDGVVEALERRDRRWTLSVQWHPERPELAAESAALFAAFVAACRPA